MDASIPWHEKEAGEALRLLQTKENGLATDEADRRLAQYGPNRLPEAAKRRPLMRFLSQFQNVLIYVLLGAAAITLIFGHIVDSAVILAVIIVNALIGFIQEGKAEKALEAIRHLLAPKATVLRDGQRLRIDGDQLVPGDIVVLEAGDKVPADLRLVSARSLQVQEAILTGESVPVEKRLDPAPADAALGDRSCLAFSGTIVTAGQGMGVVTLTGGKTEIGRISGLLSTVDTLTTPLVRQMDTFAKYLTVFILAVSLAIFAFGTLVRDMAFREVFMAVVGLSVAAIPEGLPAVLTIALAVGVQAMARRNAIIRRLPAIETLGSVSVICSDKTGTLTRNEMMVTSLLAGENQLKVSGEGYEPHGSITGPEASCEPELLSSIALAAALCNDGELQKNESGWQANGDPMECALLSFSGKAGLDWREARRLWARTDLLPFDSQTRFMASLNHDHRGQAAIFVKGAPEQLLDMCTAERTSDGRDIPLDREAWRSRSDGLAEQGQRVLALATKPVAPEHDVLEVDDLRHGLVLLGMVGLIDPPRAEAVEAIAECHRAGIRVKMITGDHAGTAVAIGRQIGLQNPQAVLTGAEIDAMTDDALSDAITATDIFARTSPEHKLRLVMALQAQGLPVAMTGDGVNDAPALKRADVGIAMGEKGSEATKEAAEFVLTDDNFVSIVDAVRQGRTVYDNLKKVISFLLPVNGGESLSLMFAILFGLTLPITPLQILWINMVSSVALAMALAFEPPEPRVMRKPPRAINAPILSLFLIWRVVFVSLIFCVGIFGQFRMAQAQGADLETARTIAVNTLVVMEIFYLFSVRYVHGSSLTLRGILGTKAVLWAVGIVTVLQFVFTYTPFMQFLFEARALSPMQGLQVIALGFVVLCVLEIEKAIIRARARGTSGTGLSTA